VRESTTLTATRFGDILGFPGLTSRQRPISSASSTHIGRRGPTVCGGGDDPPERANAGDDGVTRAHSCPSTISRRWNNTLEFICRCS
jgi:hypothetical protein